MRKEQCYICHWMTIPALSVQIEEFEQKRRFFSNKHKLISKRKTIYICHKCANVGRALIVNNIAVKTSDIIDDN